MKFLERIDHYRARDLHIFSDKFINGLKRSELARKYSLSSERIRQIIYKEVLRYNHYLHCLKVHTTDNKPVNPSGRKHMFLLRYNLDLLECRILKLEKLQDDRIQKSMAKQESTAKKSRGNK